MKFSIITPTYNRPDELKKTIESVIDQEYKNFEIIIINDSPDYDYTTFEKYLDNLSELDRQKVKYIKNKKNEGSNFSKNLALKNIKDDSDYFVFLDDDDYFSKNSLSKAFKALKSLKYPGWLVTNRYNVSQNKSLTKYLDKEKDNIKVNYILDYLIFKKFRGDATHFINSIYKNKKFSNSVKNAEEWFFFSQLEKTFTYKDIDSTLTEGYQKEGLTNSYKKDKLNKIKNTYTLFVECVKIKNINPEILLYFLLRVFAILLK